MVCLSSTLEHGLKRECGAGNPSLALCLYSPGSSASQRHDCDSSVVHVTLWVYFPWQPNPSNKLAIIHILGLLSNLFTTLDISHHDDDHESTEVKKLPVQQGPNPVSKVVA